MVVHVLASLVALWAFVAKGLRLPRGLGVRDAHGRLVPRVRPRLVVQRARPVVDDPVPHAPGYSFPSGHATNIAVVTSVLVFLLWPLLSSATRKAAVATAVAVAVVVGLDRIFLGVHFLGRVGRAAWRGHYLLLMDLIHREDGRDLLTRTIGPGVVVWG